MRLCMRSALSTLTSARIETRTLTYSWALLQQRESVWITWNLGPTKLRLLVLSMILAALCTISQGEKAAKQYWKKSTLSVVNNIGGSTCQIVTAGRADCAEILQVQRASSEKNLSPIQYNWDSPPPLDEGKAWCVTGCLECEWMDWDFRKDQPENGTRDWMGISQRSAR